MKAVLLYLIRGYRLWISPQLGGGKCRYTPTCSQYAIEAIEKHGAFFGLGLAIWRVLRCNPFSRGGWDPVPDNIRKRGAPH